MRKVLLILVLLLVPLFWGQWSIAIYAEPKVDKKVYINLYVEEEKEFINLNIPPEGVSFTPDPSKIEMGWHPFLWLIIYMDMDLKSAVNKIYTDGYILYGFYRSRERQSVIYLLASPGSWKIFIKPRDGVAFQADLYVYYGYETLLKTTYSVSSKNPSTRILEFNIPFNKIKSGFPEIDYCDIAIYWKGGCELVSLKNPDNINVLNIPNKVKTMIGWRWNYLLIYVLDLAKKGVNVDGKWTLTFREFDPDTPSPYQYPDIAVFLYDEIHKDNTIDLPPGLEITVKIEDYIPTNLPKTWHLFRNARFYIWVDKGNINDLEVREAFFYRSSTYIRCYLYKRSFILRNKGSSTLKLGLSAYIGIATQLVSKTTYDGNLVTVRFKVPSPRDLPLYVPGEERSLSISIYHPGFWRQINLYTPYNRSAQEYIEVYSNHIFTLSPVYGGNNLHVYIYTGKKPFDGWWTYKAYVPMVLVDDPLGIVDLKPPSLTGKIFRKDDRVWAHYSLLEKTHISITEKVVENGSTRYVFKNWIGNYYNGSDTFIEKIFGRAELVQERYSYDVEYYLKVVSEYGSVSGEGWYLKDSQATISVGQTEIMEGDNKRYVFTGWSGDISSTDKTTTIVMDKPKTVVANWKKQYLVVVQSEYGSVSGGGWYDEGSSATISVSPIETGFPIKRVFDHWSVNGQTYTASTVRVTVNKPLTAVAHWKEDYTMLYIIIGVIVAIIILLIIVVVKRGKKEEYPPIPPPPPPPPPK